MRSPMIGILKRAPPALLIVAMTLPARGDEIADFYRNKQVTMVVGYGPGGGYDIYARSIARYLTKYLPGNPVLVPQNMEGAGSIRAANWLYNAAAKDGTAIGLISGNLPLSQAMKESQVKFDSARLNWIGNPDAANRITFLLANTGIRTIADLQADSNKVYCGGPGVTTQSILFPQIMNNLMGTRMRIVSGYPDGASITLAMQRGEVNCRAGNSWAGIKSSMPDWVAERKINVLLEWGIEKDPQIAEYMGHDVPLAGDFAKTEADRRAIDLLVSSVAVGRPFAMPPGVPNERVAAFRTAFDRSMDDPAFRAEAARLQIEVHPLSGEKLQAFATSVAQSDDGVIRRAKELTALGDINQAR